MGIYTAVITNLSLNFFFIDPLYTFTVAALRTVVGLFIFLVVSVVGGAMLSAARRVAAEAKRRQAETEVALQTEPEKALAVLCREVVSSFVAPGTAVLISHRP